MSSDNHLYLGDFLLESQKIPDSSVDLILTDPPYGTMNGINGIDWDYAIDPKDIYTVANRILRKNGRMVLFSQQPYTTELIKLQDANLPHQYNMIWVKEHFANALLCKKAPVSYYEDILVFYKKFETTLNHPLRPYFEKVQEFIGKTRPEINRELGHLRADHSFYIKSRQFLLCTEPTYADLVEIFSIDKMPGYRQYHELKAEDEEYKKKYQTTFNLEPGQKFKSNILQYPKDYGGHHPTQKPVALLEDVIKTFTNPGDRVVDLTAGSGSTGVACKNTQRKYTLIEKQEKYYNTAKDRLK